MKKYMTAIMMLIFGSILFGCQANNTTSVKNSTEASNKTIYTTFYPVYELTKRVVGDKMAVHMMIEGNQEAHDFELSPQVMKNVQSADMVIYNGAGMESFIDDLRNAVQSSVLFIDLSQGLTLLTTDDSVSDNKNGVNPHTWLSVKNAMAMVQTIYAKVSELDRDNQAYYAQNMENVTKELEQLHQEFEQAMAQVKREPKYFVVSHAAFNYLAYDYGLKQVAVTGISPDEEPTAKQLKTIADFVTANHISTIFFEGKATPKVAKTLAESTKTKTDTLYTMETLSEDEMAKGYIALMQHNLKVLVASFND